MRIAAAFGLLGLLALLAAVASADDIVIAEDRSLASERYIERGTPAPDREWSAQDLATVASVLGELAAEDVRLLPRDQSKTSGALFERLCSEENFSILKNKTFTTVQRLTTSMEYLQSLKALLLLYADATNRGASFDSELLRLQLTLMRLCPVIMSLCNEFVATIPEDDPKREVRLAGLKKLKGGLTSIVDGALITLSERKVYRVAKLATFARELSHALPPVIGELPPLTQREIPTRLKKMASEEGDPILQPALAELSKAVPLPQ